MTLWIGTSWKMNKTLAQASSFAKSLAEYLAGADVSGIQPFVIPPATAIASVSQVLGEAGVAVGAQNAHWEDAGAWTGEISVPQAQDAGATLIEIGHSERREFFAESDHTVNLKVRATHRHGLTPLLCVGEPADVFEAGDSLEFVDAQVRAALNEVDPAVPLLLAYEPIWAIGESGRNPESHEVAGVLSHLANTYGGPQRPILYGGSVNQANAADLLKIPGVSGLFVGRAAWDVAGYIQLLEIAKTHLKSA